MMRSMYSAVAGLRTHQTRMDVIADNIANVNTTGFKKSRVTFQDIFYQTIRGGSAPSEDGRGGTNPRQIGLGTSLASIDTIHTQGAAGATGNNTDLMIQGDGFLVLWDGTDAGSYYFTRAGAFSLDSKGNLVAPGSGLYLVSTQGEPINIDPLASSFSIDAYGNVKYILDGELMGDQVIAIAKFANPGGLQKVGQNLYVLDSNADAEQTGKDNVVLWEPGNSEGGTGTLIPGALEMSNVELAQEFSEMIVTQRGFQANARVISVSDEMLQELANLKR